MNQDLEKISRSRENYLSINKSTKIIEKVDYRRRSVVRKIVVGSAALACCNINYHREVHTMEVYADLHEHPAYITIHYNK